MSNSLQRSKALFALGDHLRHYNSEDNTYSSLKAAIDKALILNGWFTQNSVEMVIQNWGEALQEQKLSQWVSQYPLSEAKTTHTIALILAGNLPLVGLHDVLCVWLCGYHALVKCASKDTALLPYIAHFLEKETGENRIEFTTEVLTGFDAVIATGTNNSARYFDHYFSKYPHIIRKNRNGVAVLSGKETNEELEGLGHDILDFFGLGCRNVSKLYLPKGFDLNRIFGGLYPLSDCINHPKYANNYDYNKAVFLMSDFSFLENGFMILREEEAMSAPIACVHYEYYDSLEQLSPQLKADQDLIQCLISHFPLDGAILFGTAQQPHLWEYADGIDTLDFLLKLSR
jgi:hypothetical protein